MGLAKTGLVSFIFRFKAPFLKVDERMTSSTAEVTLPAATKMRPGDAVCIGVFTEDNPQMLRADVALFSKYLEP